MELGPVEFLVIEFPGNKFSGEISPALQACVDKGVIRVIDIIFATRDQSGTLTVLELDDLDGDIQNVFAPFVHDVSGMLSHEDVQLITDSLEPNSSAVMLVFEHTWATELRDAIAHADGRLVTGGLIPREAVEAALSWLKSEPAQN